MAASRTGQSGARRAFVIVAIIVVVLALALSGAWVFLARELDRLSGQAIAEVNESGVALDCAGRDVFGYPFRLGLSCDALTIDAPESTLRATTGAFRTASQIYDPARIVAEIDSPAFLDTQDLPPLDLRWDLAQMSVRLGLSGLRRGSLVVDAPEVSLAGPAGDSRPLAAADQFQFHLRGRDGNLDVAANDRALRLLAPEFADLPPMDASLDLSIIGAEPWLTGALPEGSARDILGGREGTLRSVRLDFGGPHVELSGPWRFSADGLLSAELELALSEPERIAEIVAELVPGFAPAANQAASAVGFLGRRENGRSILSLTVRDGQANLGVIPLGEVPPLR